MDTISQITTWVTENESLLSGFAALFAILAIFPALLRPMRRLRAGTGLAAPSTAPPPRSALPRIAVLPFDAADDSPDARTESELLQRELATLLARSDGCEVISTNAAQGYALGGGTPQDARLTLDVQYVVEGEVRRNDDGYRVTTHLIDTESQRLIWSEALDVPAADEHELSVRVAQRVASHLGLEIVRTEVGRAKNRPRSRESRDLLLQAQGLLFAEGHHKATYEKAIAMLERATARTPDFAEAYGLMALLFALGSVFGFFERTDAFKQKVFEICQKAIELDDRSSEVLGFVGCAYCDLHQYEKGIPLLDRAVEHNPSNAQARAALGAGLAGLGRYEESAACLEDALHLSPAFKGIAPWATVLANSYVALGRLDEASGALEKALRCDPNFFPAHLTGARIATLEGNTAKASRHLDEACRIQPDLVETLGDHRSDASGSAAGETDGPLLQKLDQAIDLTRSSSNQRRS